MHEAIRSHERQLFPHSSFKECWIKLDILPTSQITSGICADSQIVRCSSKEKAVLITEMFVVQEEDDTYY